MPQTSMGPDGAIRRVSALGQALFGRYAKHCLDLANTLQDPKGRAALLQMAQVWLRLAQRHVEEETSDQLNR